MFSRPVCYPEPNHLQTFFADPSSQTDTLESANPVPVPQKLKKAFPKPKNLKKKAQTTAKKSFSNLKGRLFGKPKP